MRVFVFRCDRCKVYVGSPCYLVFEQDKVEELPLHCPYGYEHRVKWHLVNISELREVLK